MMIIRDGKTQRTLKEILAEIKRNIDPVLWGGRYDMFYKHEDKPLLTVRDWAKAYFDADDLISADIWDDYNMMVVGHDYDIEYDLLTWDDYQNDFCEGSAPDDLEELYPRILIAVWTGAEKDQEDEEE